MPQAKLWKVRTCRPHLPHYYALNESFLPHSKPTLTVSYKNGPLKKNTCLGVGTQSRVSIEMDKFKLNLLQL
jgi:hypothetical protein